MQIIDFVSQLGSVLNGLFSLFKLLLDSIISGFQFSFTSFSVIPQYIFDTLSSMPSFFQIGLFGVFGLVIGITILKIVSIIFIQGG